MFGLVVRGRINKQIAHELGTTERTIKAHRHQVMEKMKVQSLAELVSIAERLGLLDERDSENRCRFCGACPRDNMKIPGAAMF